MNYKVVKKKNSVNKDDSILSIFNVFEQVLMNFWDNFKFLI